MHTSHRMVPEPPRRSPGPYVHVGFRTTLRRDTPSPCPLTGWGGVRVWLGRPPPPLRWATGNVSLWGGGWDFCLDHSVPASTAVTLPIRERGLAPTHPRGGHTVAWLWGWAPGGQQREWPVDVTPSCPETRQPESLQAAS